MDTQKSSLAAVMDTKKSSQYTAHSFQESAAKKSLPQNTAHGLQELAAKKRLPQNTAHDFQQESAAKKSLPQNTAHCFQLLVGLLVEADCFQLLGLLLVELTRPPGDGADHNEYVHGPQILAMKDK